MDKDIFGIGVIGYGYWGPNLVRNFMQLNESNVAMVSDLNEDRLQKVKENYPSVLTTVSYKDIIENPEIDAVAIATPVHTHFKFASEALESGKHVFIEKPMCASGDEGEHLIKLSENMKRKLMVGHTFLYTSAVNKMKEVIESGELGEIYYINAQRLNLGLFQQDINVVWDLAPHDISIILYLLNREPLSVQYIGASHINPSIEDIAVLTLKFSNDIIAFVQSSWLDPDKVRKITVVGSRKMMVYDDVQASEKIRIYDKGVEVPKHYDTYAEFHYSYKYGDIVIPKLDGSEPLRTQLSHFLDCIKYDKIPRSDGYNGLQVVKILEQAKK
jgi:predicted dehydrogenase